MSAHSKTPYITLVWIFLWEWGSTGAQGAAAGITLVMVRWMGHLQTGKFVIPGHSTRRYLARR